MELVHVRLVVQDFGPMFRFYRDVVGLVPQVDDDRGPYGKLSFSGGAAIALQTHAHVSASLGPLTVAGGERIILAIRVDDLDATKETLAARGARFLVTPPVAWGRMRVAHVRDPEGNLVELQQWQ